jgi:lysozyme
MLRLEAGAVWPSISQAVKVRLNQNQADALISLVYNIGFQAFLDSTLLKRINASAPRSEIVSQWTRWVHAGGQVLPGLVRRREAEAQLYFS